MSLSEAYGLRAAVCFGFEVTRLFVRGCCCYLFEVAAVVCFRLQIHAHCRHLVPAWKAYAFGKSYPRELSDGARLTSDGSPRGHQQTSYEQQ